LALKKCGFQGTFVSLCSRRKYSVHGVVFFRAHANDFLVIGNDKGINDVLDGLKTYKFGLKIVDDLKDWLIYEILIDYKKKRTFVMQPHLIKNLKKLRMKSTI
jgi:hypothetical protein